MRIDVAEIAERLSSQNQAWTELLRSDHLSVGVYRLEAGAIDGQSPHQEDEVYCVIEGKAQLRVAEEVHDVSPGVAVFVPAKVEHRFENISETLVTLVFFAPPESTAPPE